MEKKASLIDFIWAETVRLPIRLFRDFGIFSVKKTQLSVIEKKEKKKYIYIPGAAIRKTHANIPFISNS